MPRVTDKAPSGVHGTHRAVSRDLFRQTNRDRYQRSVCGIGIGSNDLLDEHLAVLVLDEQIIQRLAYGSSCNGIRFTGALSSINQSAAHQTPEELERTRLMR